MVNDIVATEIVQNPCSFNGVRHPEIVSHDLDPEIITSTDDQFDGFLVGLSHDHDVSGPGFGHHLRFEPSAIHGFEIGHDWSLWKGLMQFAYSIHAFGDYQRGSSLEPIHARAQGHRRSLEG